MKHGRDDYNDLANLADKIPEHEPVFLIRGQDKAGHKAVRAYAREAELAGAGRDFVIQVMDQADCMEKFAADFGKIPDLPAPTENKPEADKEPPDSVGKSETDDSSADAKNQSAATETEGKADESVTGPAATQEGQADGAGKTEPAATE